MRPLKAGIIGLGVGEQHLVSYADIPGCSVRAICDIDPAKLKDVGDRHGIGHRFADYRAIVEDPEIDVVSVCSYDDAHAEQVVAAFRNGKHVMVEKPVALNPVEAEAVVRAQQDSGRLISSNLILRRSPRFIRLRDMIQAGEFGEIFYMEGDYIHQILWKITEGWRGRMPFYCVTYGGGIHLIDLMRWMIGQEIVEVSGMANKILTRDTSYRFDDTFVNLLRFEGGCLAKTLTTFGPQRPKFHALNIYGTRGTFLNDVPDARIHSSDDPADEERDATPYPGMRKGDLLPDFVAAIREGREPAVSATDVFRVMAVCFATWESVRAGRTVRVDYLL